MFLIFVSFGTQRFFSLWVMFMYVEYVKMCLCVCVLVLLSQSWHVHYKDTDAKGNKLKNVCPLHSDTLKGNEKDIEQAGRCSFFVGFWKVSCYVFTSSPVCPFSASSTLDFTHPLLLLFFWLLCSSFVSFTHCFLSRFHSLCHVCHVSRAALEEVEKSGVVLKHNPLGDAKKPAKSTKKRKQHSWLSIESDQCVIVWWPLVFFFFCRLSDVCRTGVLFLFVMCLCVLFSRCVWLHRYHRQHCHF